MIELHSRKQASHKYDCIECGCENSVSVYKNRGFCDTPGCLKGELIQFVFYPAWPKVKACLAGREMWWVK